jgi:hypothetical protein
MLPRKLEEVSGALHSAIRSNDLIRKKEEKNDVMNAFLIAERERNRNEDD